MIRGTGAVGLLAAAVISWPHSWIIGVAFGLSAGFVAFEAARGWCVLRACGLKTKF